MPRPPRLRPLDADCIPIGEHLARADARFALAWWHWFFFGQLEKPAERVINADPEAWYANTADHMGRDAHADLWAALRDPQVVHGMVEDYRAGLGVDRAADDDEDRARGKKITCPTLVGWSTEDDLEELYGDVVAIWRTWATDVRGVAIHSGHHMAEEAPDELSRELLAFFGATGDR